MIGTRYFSFVDESRKEVLGNDNGYRRIAVRLYYPGKKVDDAKRAKLFTDKKLKLFKKYDFTHFNELMDIYEDLPIAEGSFPLIVYSHGYGSLMEDNNILFQRLAENGYIVASVGHSYEAVQTLYTDGSESEYDRSADTEENTLIGFIKFFSIVLRKLDRQTALKKFDDYQRSTDPFMSLRVVQWGLDSQYIIDRIKEMNQDETSFLYQKIDFKGGVGTSGHSFGGDTAYYLCLNSPDISCGVNLDGALFGDYGQQMNHKPFLQIDCKNSVNVVTRALLYTDAPIHFMVFKDMVHVAFTDLKYISTAKRGLGKADADTALGTVQKAHVEFFNRYLKNRDIENREKLSIDESALENYEVN